MSSIFNPALVLAAQGEKKRSNMKNFSPKGVGIHFSVLLEIKSTDVLHFRNSYFELKLLTTLCNPLETGASF